MAISPPTPTPPPPQTPPPPPPPPPPRPPSPPLNEGVSDPAPCDHGNMPRAPRPGLPELVVTRGSMCVNAPLSDWPQNVLHRRAVDRHEGEQRAEQCVDLRGEWCHPGPTQGDVTLDVRWTIAVRVVSARQDVVDQHAGHLRRWGWPWQRARRCVRRGWPWQRARRCVRRRGWSWQRARRCVRRGWSWQRAREAGVTMTAGTAVCEAGVTVTEGTAVCEAEVTVTEGTAVCEAGVTVTAGTAVCEAGVAVTEGTAANEAGVAVTAGTAVSEAGVRAVSVTTGWGALTEADCAVGRRLGCTKAGTWGPCIYHYVITCPPILITLPRLSSVQSPCHQYQKTHQPPLYSYSKVHLKNRVPTAMPGIATSASLGGANLPPPPIRHLLPSCDTRWVVITVITEFSPTHLCVLQSPSNHQETHHEVFTQYYYVHGPTRAYIIHAQSHTRNAR